MDITEVRIKLMEEPGERLKAFCSITFDNCFVVRDLKIIEGTSGPFVAMPSRKLTCHCHKCGTKNHLRAQHCNQCGASVANDRLPLDADGRAKLYADIAHPINSACREHIQKHVIDEYFEELQRAQRPDYVSRYDDFDLDGSDSQIPASPVAPSVGRVDRAHSQPSAHTPSSGGAAQASEKHGGPVPPPKSPRAPTSSPASDSDGDSGDGFGAGIFS